MREDLSENVLVFEDADGKEIEAQILFTTNLEEFPGNNYVIFQFLDTGDIQAARFTEEKDGIGELMDIETQEEIDKLNDVIESFFNEFEDDDVEIVAAEEEK